jgi:hypothetical protein
MKLRLLIFMLLFSHLSIGQVSIISHTCTEFSASPVAMVGVTLMNEEQAASEVSIRATITDLNGVVLCEVLSNPAIISTGVSVFKSTGFKSIRYADASITNSLRTTGILPFGQYKYCVEVLAGLVERVDEYCEGLDSDYLEFLNLVSPADGDTVYTPVPVLSWIHSGDFGQSTNSSFNMVLVEMRDQQSAQEAILSNSPFWTDLSLRGHQSFYSSASKKLKEGGKYAWQVQRVYNGKIIQTSEVWHFVMQEPKEEKDLKYVNLKKGVHPQIIDVYSRLYLRFDEAYSNGGLSYSILDSNGKLCQIPMNKDMEALQTGSELISVGFNAFEIDLLKYNLQPGVYKVKIDGQKKQAYELQIRMK